MSIVRSIHEQKMAIFPILNNEHSAFMSNWVGVVKHLPVRFFCVFSPSPSGSFKQNDGFIQLVCAKLPRKLNSLKPDRRLKPSWLSGARFVKLPGRFRNPRKTNGWRAPK